ncbi:MAG: indole-3-glycerol phosphate synthase TrpC [Rhodothermaceae bacterium]|nr:indole-3-glycerol phosphate synthase TrpC [Rhodothermaceae bacterium]MYD20136.1 indole-3-glycerol phosphate synthase TrpC [Rhodothermaceae bacterium]MYD57557.1 indole-3-glycerol phosphate synthase TrpC [Rhodothermaceae bacterium]MYI42945.1 indole-3-glycerol phosphate synthase TrpC [Rhodothermaceae bacterium]MYJ55231.1 indole-3-glycerol phosphate synthase TrpC [Rhodothermaceae bacterium]
MTVLDRIVTDVKISLERRKSLTPVHELEAAIRTARSVIDFEAALTGPELAVIAEIKRRSPSKGLLREPFDVQALAKDYAAAGANAISVLTEEDHFGGSLSHLALAAANSNCPLLRKDFIIDPYQLYEARACGADAVLLIAAILEASQLKDLLTLAAELKLASLVEVYDPTELDKIDFDQVSILGVNNRDLHTFEVDIDHSPKVFELVGSEVIKVSESGLRSPADLAYLHRRGVNAVLIGETFMRAENPGVALRSLREMTATILTSHTN